MEERLLTPREVAAYLGVPVSTLYQWRHRGSGPPAIRVGPRQLRWRPGDVEQWLAAQADEQPEPTL